MKRASRILNHGFGSEDRRVLMTAFGSVALANVRAFGYGHVELCGSVSSRTLAHAQGAVQRWIAAAGIPAYIIEIMATSTVAVGDPVASAELALRSVPASGSVYVPSVLLVPPDLEDWAQDFCYHFGLNGLGKRAFTAAGEAVPWLLDETRVLGGGGKSPRTDPLGFWSLVDRSKRGRAGGASGRARHG